MKKLNILAKTLWYAVGTLAVIGLVIGIFFAAYAVLAYLYWIKGF